MKSGTAHISTQFTCLLCQENGCVTVTGKHPRDRKDADIVICGKCGHIQMWPLLSEEEEKEEYNNDKTVRFGGISGGSDFESMRIKFSEWTKEHVKIYFDMLQKFDNVLEIGAGYGFFMEALNAGPERRFNIEGIEIGRFRLDNFVGGVAHNVNVLNEHCSYFSADILRLAFEKAGYYVESISTHEIYSIENHCRWVREGVPFTKYNQMFMPDERLEWINQLYKDEISKRGKGFALTIQATVK